MSQLIPQLDYSPPEAPNSIVEHRELLQVSNAGNGQLSPNQSTQFVISSSDRVLDGEKTWFSLEMKTDELGATPKAITDIFKSVEVLMNGQRIELVDDVAALETVMRRVMFSNSYRKYDNQPGLVYDDDRLNVRYNTVENIAADQLVGGANALAENKEAKDVSTSLALGLEANDTPKGKKVRAMAAGYVRFAFKLNSIGSLMNGKFLPLLYTNGLELRFQLHNVKQAMSSTLGAPANSDFTIRNFRMHYEVIQLTKQASSMLSEYHRAGELQLHIHSFAHSLKTTTGSFSHEVPSNKNIVTEIIHCQRATANLSDEKKDSHQYMGYNAANFTEAQCIYADNTRIPNKPFQGSVEAYMFLKNASPIQSFHADTISYYDFSGDGDLVAKVDTQKSGIMIWPLETLPESDLNGVSTKNGRKLVIDYNSTSNTAVQNDFFLGYEAIINLEADGSVSVEE